MSDEANKTVKESQPAPISSTSPGAGEDLLRAGIMQQPDQPGMLGKIGRFDVIKVLGQGGMGEVLLAREPATNVKVAIKVLKPQLAQDNASVHRFLTEARHAYAMGHPNILKVMEVSGSDDRPFYVVPYIESGSLARRIGPQKPLPTNTALDIARQVASALSYAHGRGIIHRDLKPANVLMDREGHAYLTDFGLLRTVFNDSFVDVQQSSLEGTAPYMSPAVVQGKAEDTRCDIYSFGAMLYEMLTGQPPYTAPSIEIILKKIAAGPPEPILKVNPKASKELAAIAEWAMARELRDRYATMADVLSDLERVAKGKEPVGPRGTVGLGKPTRRNLAIAGAALAVVAMVAFVFSKMAPSTKTGTASIAGAHQNLVVNGSFESPIVGLTEKGRNFPSGSTDIMGWTVGSPGNVDIVRYYWPASDGFNSLNLSGVLKHRSISQEISLVKGMAYLLTFDMAYCVNLLHPASLEVSIGGYSKSLARDPAAGAPFWRRQSLTFTATNTGLATLTFQDTTPGVQMDGAAIDNVSLIAVSSNEIQKLSVSASPTVPTTAPAMLPPPPAVPGAAQPGARPVPGRALRLPSPNPAAIPAPVPMPVTPPSAALPPQPPDLSIEEVAARRAFAARAQNLITNGGFELGPLVPGQQYQELSLKLGSTQIPGWTIVSDELTINGETNSGCFVELTGHTDSPPHGGVTQTIATRIGQMYRLSLDLGLFVNPSAGYTVRDPISILVSAGPTNVSFTNYASVKGSHWSTYSFVFIAQASTTPITIVGSVGTYAIWLDNVSVEPWNERANLLANGDFELEGEPGKPAQWSTFDWSDGKSDIKFEWSTEAHSGKRSVAISSKEKGDGNWFQSVTVQPWQNYRFSGWVKTEGVESKGGQGAYIDASPGQGANMRNARNIIRGSNDWQRLETVFNALPCNNLVMQCIFGSWGPVAGKAWFDDVSLVAMKEISRGEGQMVNGSFEEADEGWPLGWSVRTWAFSATKFAHAKTGHTGSRSIKITAQPFRSGVWIFMAKVKRNASYKLSGWIRTENLTGGARASLGVVEFLPNPSPAVFTEGLAETRDWTPVSVTVASAQNDWIQIGCQLTEGGDTAAGDAWFDDIELEEVPAPAPPSPRPAVPVPVAPPRADWRSILKQADAAYAENRFDEAIKFYDAALAGMKQDQTTDATILKTMKAAAVKHRGLASFIPQRDKLPADKQVEALHTKLRELSPNYNGKGDFIVQDGKIVKALLNSLGLTDLSPLKGLPLTLLSCENNKIRDLSPLQGMPLTSVYIHQCQVADLSPLRGMKLTTLWAGFNSITDISLLAGMPLTYLNLDEARILDLSPLRGMKLEWLAVCRSGITNLAPLASMPLHTLVCVGNRIADLSPLKGMPLAELDCGQTEVTDLTTLEGATLKTLRFSADRITKGMETIRKMKSIELIDGTGGKQNPVPAAEFWKRFDAGEFSNAVPK